MMRLGEEHVKKMQEAAYESIRLDQAKQKKRYDAHHRTAKYEVGALVLV